MGLKVTFDNREIYEKKFKNQIYFLLTLMSEIRLNKLNIRGLAFRSKFLGANYLDFRNIYKKETYRDFI